MWESSYYIWWLQSYCDETCNVFTISLTNKASGAGYREVCSEKRGVNYSGISNQGCDGGRDGKTRKLRSYFRDCFSLLNNCQSAIPWVDGG